ncbi:RICIN domain-containing protein [Kitasatospora sp. NPDC048540]|uniref:RICIN domain-containing protein n=1 Tax=unclassified Kitasatospora TaxID=2633591 RepID=UPI000691979B|nr:RICIN domain-containing protein [Kitasatospora sp. MBT63]
MTKSFRSGALGSVLTAIVLSLGALGVIPAQAAAPGPPGAPPGPGGRAPLRIESTVRAGVTAYGPFLIRNAATGWCVNLPGQGAGRPGGIVNLFTCDGTAADNQLYWWDHQGDGLFTLRNAKDNLCLDAPGTAAVEAGTRVGESYCDNIAADNQLYRLVPRPDRTLWIVNDAAGLCLGTETTRTGRDGARIALVPCGDTADRRWQLTGSGAPAVPAAPAV